MEACRVLGLGGFVQTDLQGLDQLIDYEQKQVKLHMFMKLIVHALHMCVHRYECAYVLSVSACTCVIRKKKLLKQEVLKGT